MTENYTTNFEKTLSIIQSILNTRLIDGYKKIWVQGSNKPSGTILVFTMFNEHKHIMKFISIKNFRQFRQESNIEEEMILINRQIDSFKTTLQNFIKYE